MTANISTKYDMFNKPVLELLWKYWDNNVCFYCIVAIIVVFCYDFGRLKFLYKNFHVLLWCQWNWLLIVALDCYVKLFSDVKDDSGLTLFESGRRTVDKQETHTIDAAKLLELHLKRTLLGLVHKLFGKGEYCYTAQSQFEINHIQLFICSVNQNNFAIKVFNNGIYSEKYIPC